jgi:predicted nucleic acid-binding protein
VIARRPVVIDASVALALLLDEPEAPLVREAIAGWTSRGRARIVPEHFWLEVVGRLGRTATGTLVLEAFHRLDTLGLETVDTDRPLLILAIDRMERFGLTVYDAVYLALADQLGAELATFDSELAAAAGDILARIGGPSRTSEVQAIYEHDVTWPRYKEASAYLAQLRAEALAGRG